MFKNYFKIAVRNLVSQKVFSFINIIGLAIGMAACLLIVLYITNELKYDQHHVNKDRVYRLEGFYEKGGKTIEQSAVSNFAIAPLLAANYPEVQGYARLLIGSSTIKIDNRIYSENGICYTDSSFFDLFSCEFLEGNPDAINEPNAVVIDDLLAKKYFGHEKAAGRSFLLDGKNVKITGVIRQMPQTSHVHAQMILSGRTIVDQFPPWVNNIRSGGTSHYTYLLLEPSYDPKKLEAQFPAFTKKYMHESFGLGEERLYLRPLTDIHLNSHTTSELEVNGDMDSIYLFGLVAVIILLIACVNYINLATARAADRAKEIGLRKVTGASRTQLVSQFLGESVLLSVVAMIIAYLVAMLFLPALNQLTDKSLSLTAEHPFKMFLTTFVFAILIGILAGVYPAFVITSGKLTQVLRGTLEPFSGKGFTLRKSLVVFQFCISIVLLIAMFLIYSQLTYIRKKNLGIEAGQLLTITVDGKIREQFKALKTELLNNSAVLAVSSANNNLSSGNTNWRQYFGNKGQIDNLNVATMDVDVDFFTTLKAEMAAGRGFSERYVSDAAEAYVINETAAKFMNLKDPLNEPLSGSVFNGTSWSRKNGKIIGIVKDFHFASLKQEIKPVVFNLQSQLTDPPAHLFIRIKKEDVARTLKFIESTWKKFEPEFPMVYSFLTEDINKMYHEEDNFLRLFIIFCVLAALISCLGILGLSSYATVKRTKEIGVRKVLGASVQRIVLLLSVDYVKLVFLAFVIACPIGWYLMSKWLTDYPYRVNVSPWPFLLAGSCALLIALLTISSQSLKAAAANPVKSLRTE